MRHLSAAGHRCTCASDIAPLGDFIDASDALSLPQRGLIITNPPFERRLLLPLLHHWVPHQPTILLLPADHMMNQWFSPFAPHLACVVPVGRISWLNNGVGGFDNHCWMAFDPTPQTFLKPRRHPMNKETLALAFCHMAQSAPEDFDLKRLDDLADDSARLRVVMKLVPALKDAIIYQDEDDVLEVRELRDQVDDLESQITDLETKIADLRELRDQTDNLESQITDLEAKITDLNKENDDLQAQIDLLEDLNNELQAGT